MALGIVPGDPYLATKAFANLKAELDKEKADRITGQVKIDVLTRAIKDLKIPLAGHKSPPLKTRLNTLKTRWWMGWMKSWPGNFAWSAPLTQTRIIRNRMLS
jgi:hypothetical protein